MYHVTCMRTVVPWGYVVGSTSTGELVEGRFPTEERENGDYGFR